MSPVHDYVIDNSTGANVRADINNVLQAILTNNSSSSAPSTTAAYMWWADTTNGVLKIRNSSNNDWVELLQLDGTLTLEDGSASTPALAFRDDLNTGIFSSAADTFNVATGGVERMELGATTIFNEDGADVDFRIEGDTEVNLFYVDAGNNKIGIGTATPGQLLHLKSSAPAIQFEDTGANGSAISVIEDNDGFLKLRNDPGNAGTGSGIGFEIDASERMRIDSSGRLLLGTSTASSAGNSQYSLFEVSGNTSSSTGVAHLTLKKGQTSANLSDGDSLGRLIFSSLDGGDFAFIQVSVDGSPSGSDFPGSMRFHTCADGASTSTERMRIDSSGNVGIGTTSPQTDLHITDTSAAPTIRLSSAANGLTELQFGDANDTVRGNIVYRNGTAGDALCFNGYNNTERMRIDSSGRVGIGTTSPSTPLHVVGSDNTTTLLVESTDADANVGPIIELYRNSASAADNDALGRIDFRGTDDGGNASTFARIAVTALDVTNNTEDARLDFVAVTNDTFTPTMSITGGNVGIGESSPDELLHLKSATTGAVSYTHLTLPTPPYV